MKARTIGYWATTGLLAFAFGAGGLMDLSRSPEIMKTFAHLGYPAYFASLLGVWKLLGALAILAPRAARLKEWAYAGIAFDLTGALVSHVTVGDGVSQLVAPLALLGVAVASWVLRPESRTLQAHEATAPAASRAPMGEPQVV